jgi:4-hydroxy-tetrahydrodipicolinate synthase
VIKLKKNFLRGSYPPVVTPFKHGEVDYDKFAEIVDYMIDNGTHGILVTSPRLCRRMSASSSTNWR